MADIESGLIEGDIRLIIAETGQTFLYWSGDTQYLADSGSSSTVVTIPAGDVEVTAVFTQTTLKMTVDAVGGDTVDMLLLYDGGGSFEMDWDDGTVETINGDYKKKKGAYAYYPSHIYTSGGTYNLDIPIPLSGAQLFDMSLDSITDISFPYVGGLSVLYIYGDSITTFDISLLSELEIFQMRNTSITSVTSSILPDSLTDFDVNNSASLTNLDISSLTILDEVSASNSNLATVNLSSNNLLKSVNFYNNVLTVSSINDMLDDLIVFNQAGTYFNTQSQTPSAVPDSGKVSALDAIWTTVLVDGGD